jgi:DNA invertase Pin-like site-specific DNA recombinase
MKTAAAYSYLRFSTDEQEEGDSTRRQIGLREGWLKRHPHVTLDTSQLFEDRGVSGFRGKHRKGKCALASFLDLVERGRVPHGSYLIVESLDRLTREEPEVAVPLILRLIEAGIKVVQLTPWESVYEKGQDMGRFIGMVAEAYRGHGESARKSGMLKERWDEKRRAAREERQALGASCPFWLEFVRKPGSEGKRHVEGTYVPVPEKVVAVVRVFQLSAEGLGALGIARRLNAEGVPAIGRGGAWLRTYVRKLLSNRSVLGEFQPMKDGKPDGEAVPDFFPRAVPDDLWHKAHAAMRSRNNRGVGMGGKRSVHLFSGLLRCALDQCPLVTREHRVKGGRPRKFLASAAAVQGRTGAHPARFPLDTFTDAILKELKEVKVADVFASPNSERIVKLEAAFAEVERKLNDAKARWETDQENTAWADLIDKWGRKRNSLAKEMRLATMEAANPLTATWAEAINLMRAREQRPEQLRTALLRAIIAVHCVFVDRATERLAAVQVYFVGGAHRDYLIVHQHGTTGAAGVRPARSWAKSLAPDAVQGDLDLRDPEQARQFAEELSAMDVEPAGA